MTAQAAGRGDRWVRLPAALAFNSSSVASASRGN
jgi:hypothetical protein